MHSKTVFLIRENKISAILEQSLSNVFSVVNYLETRPQEIQVDGLVVLTSGLDVDRNDQELIELAESRRVPVRRVDLSGTIQVAVSGLDLWMKNNKCQSVLFTGSDTVCENENLTRFLDRLA